LNPMSWQDSDAFIQFILSCAENVKLHRYVQLLGTPIFTPS
jgi:hypothetical protein